MVFFAVVVRRKAPPAGAILAPEARQSREAADELIGRRNYPLLSGSASASSRERAVVSSMEPLRWARSTVQLPSAR